VKKSTRNNKKLNKIERKNITKKKRKIKWKITKRKGNKKRNKT
jgi:hypothetical protein